TGQGALNLSSDNAYAGKIVVDITDNSPNKAGAGGLYIGRNDISTGSITGSIDLASSDSSVYFGRTTNLTYWGKITGAGNVYKRGPSQLTLMGVNEYTGKTVVEGADSVLSVST